MQQAEFRDPRLVEIYDAECPWSRDDDFFVSIVGPTPARVLDFGCGTGRLALGLAARGHDVTGVDPAPASLAAARGKPGARAVHWIEGASAALATASPPLRRFDVAVMTSHVAQFLVDDDQWSSTLADLHRALVPGGTLTFDMRDPHDRRWERWNPVDSLHRVVIADGVVVVWTEVTSVDNGVVSFTRHYQMPDGQELTSEAALRFRSEQDVRVSLHAAGFSLEHVFGGWQREPVGAVDGELLFVART